MERWFVPDTPAVLPLAASVLVVAPHPDDEVFGCGGCSILYAQAGARVHPFILTDGAGYLAGKQRQSAIETRRAESLQAAQHLGTQPPMFGQWADRHLGSAADLAAQLVEQIESTGAQVVFSPSLWEVHPDHRAAAWAAITALRSRARSGASVPTLIFYEVGAPLRPSHLVDITDVFNTKKQAMACFTSQLAQQRYDIHIAALNTYRTYTLPSGVTAAEALSIVTPQELQAFAHTYGESSAAATAGSMEPGLASVTEMALQRAGESAELMQARLVEQGQTIASLNAAMASLISSVEQLRSQTSEQHSRLEVRDSHAAELQASLQARDSRIVELQASLQARDSRIVELQASLQARDSRIVELQASLQARDSCVAELQASLQEVFASRSWRVTRLLRWISGRVR